MTNHPRHIGKFEILERLGEGALGEVFLARDRLLGREVAIKTIRPSKLTVPDARDRFFREAQATGRLNHTNLVTIHEFGEDQGLLYTVMEYVPGEDLAQVMRSGQLTPQGLLDLLAQICDGLAFAHQRGMLHRDLKPTNIRVTRVGGRLTAKILDFGVARLAATDITSTGTIKGTFGYMAPEYLRTGKADTKSDLYGVGVMLYEAMAGFNPFAGDTTATVLHRVLHEEPPPLDLEKLDSISPAIQGIVNKALSKNAADRYSSAELLGAALRSAKDPAWDPALDKADQGRNAWILDVPKPAKAAPASPGGRGWKIAAGIVALLVAGAAGGGLWLRHARQARAVVVPPPPPPPPPVVPAPVVPEEPKPEPKPAFASLDDAEAALETDPKGILAFLEDLVAKEPGNERALALRIVALYNAGYYPDCGKAMVQARASGHPIWPMALKFPPLKNMLIQDQRTPRLPRPKVPPPAAAPHPAAPAEGQG